MSKKQEAADEPTITIGRKEILEGGKFGGQYLDEIGKTDLADLSEEEWFLFLARCFARTFYSAHNNTLSPPF